MIQKPPIFLFAFANDTSNSLSLEKEERIIRENLKHLHDGGRIDHQIMGASTLDDLFKSLNRFHDRVHVLHYGGHSDAEFLMLRDKKARGANLARIIGMQKNLKLVFLNGCANKAQVEELFEQGVKAIIATSVPIGDDKAVVFSDAFYDALKGGKTIKESFETASDRVLEEFPGMDGQINRGLLLRANLQKKEEDFPWALYATEDAELNWTIPDAYKVPEDLDYHAKVELNLPEANKKLVELTFEGMTSYSRKNSFLWEDYLDASSKETNIYDLRLGIYNAFPSLLSIHIQDVFTNDATREGRLRLKELTDVYLVLSKLMLAIALSNLWRVIMGGENYQPKTDFTIPNAYKEDLKNYLTLSKEDADLYDPYWLLLTIGSILKENEVKPFIEEGATFYKALSDDERLYAAFQFLEYDLKRRFLARNIPSLEVAELCEEAEYHLGILLNQCGFLTNYQLISVRDISVKNILYSAKTFFIHNKVVLRGVEETIMDRDPLQLNSFSYNHAIILTKNFNSEDPPLILTPFLIDENIYKIKQRDQPKIHFWAGKTQGKKDYFQHVEVLEDGFEFPNETRNIYHVQKMMEIRGLINQFAKDLGLEV